MNQIIQRLLSVIELLKGHNVTLQSKIPPSHTPNDGLVKAETARIHSVADDAVAEAQNHLCGASGASIAPAPDSSSASSESASTESSPALAPAEGGA